MKAKGNSLVAEPHDRRPEPLAGWGLPDDSVRRLEKALCKQWKRYGLKLKVCQRDFSEDAIHDFRVEARRLLSTVGLLGRLIPAKPARKIHAAIKGHLDTFDAVRDAQVQLPEVEQMRPRFPAAVPFGDYLRRRLERFTRSARKEIRKARTRRVGGLVDSCAAAVRARRKKYFGARGAALLLRSTDRAFARVVRLQTQIDPNVPATIHCTRVAFKKFRYMAETLGDFLPARNETLAEAMHAYQTAMGEIQDADVLCQGFERFSHKRPIRPELARPFVEELYRRRRRLIDAYLRGAARLFDFWARPPRPRAGRLGLPSPGERI